MGKKKRQKTKELSVAIAEASFKGGGDIEQQQQQQQQPPQAPRKRGRPRKVIVVETESQVKPIEEEEEETEASTAATHGTKKKEEEKQDKLELTSAASACTREEIQLPKREPSRSRSKVIERSYWVGFWNGKRKHPKNLFSPQVLYFISLSNPCVNTVQEIENLNTMFHSDTCRCRERKLR